MRTNAKDSGRKKKKKNIDDNTQSPTTSEELINVDSISLDLKIEILSRFPAKTLVRVVSTSKLFAPIIRHRDFINSFLTYSLIRPRLLFTLANHKSRVFFISSPYDNTESSSLLDCTKCLVPWLDYRLSHSVGGLILYEDVDSRLVVCNPTTGQVVTLPRIKSKRISSFLGYDPIDNHCKVLCMTQERIAQGNERKSEYQVVTVGSKKSWRMIECGTHCPITDGLCIDGVVYYGACRGVGMEERSLVSFDVRSEKFSFIGLAEDVEKSCLLDLTLINYMGKLAVTVEGTPGYCYLWVLEDARRHEWSKVCVFCPSLVDDLHITGTSHTGEVIFAPLHLCYPFYVVFYNIRRGSSRRVEIVGIDSNILGDSPSVTTFPNHAENITRFV